MILPDLSALLAICTSLSSLLGLLIGSFLNVVIWRVPRGESLLPDSHCPHCDAPIRPWQNVPVISWLVLRGRCANCRACISARYPLIELTTAVAFGLVAWWFIERTGIERLLGGEGSLPAVAACLALAAYLWFAAASIALTAIDLELKRLPDAIVLPSLAVVLILLGSSSILLGDWPALIATLGGAAAMFAAYFLIVLVYPAGMGGGDVKLAPVVGAVLGFSGWGAVAVGGFAGFVIAAIVGLALIAARKAGRKTGIPFGPFMLLGGWIGIVVGEQVMASYLTWVGIA